MIASWPGPDPAIHVYRRPRGVDHRVKPGDDDKRVKPGDDDKRCERGEEACHAFPRPRQGERGRVRGRKKENPPIEYRP